MKRLLLLTFVLCPALARAEGSWIFRPSTFSHDPAGGERVNQYAPEKTPYARVDPTYQQSAYRHSRSGLNVDGSFDYQHIVETWGDGANIRPYGEWLYPYRAGATPYGPWGNPAGAWTTPYGPWPSWPSPYPMPRPMLPQPLPVVPNGQAIGETGGE